MQRIERRSPEWEAPETLLPRVIAAVEADERKAARAHGWPLPARIALAACACLVFAAGQWLLSMDSVRELFDPFVTAGAAAADWLAAADGVVRALNLSAGAVFGNTMIMLVLLATGTAMTLVLLGTAIGFSYILNLDKTRGIA